MKKIFCGYLIIASLAGIICSDYALAQTSPTWKGISSPLDTAIVLAGTFGEIRSNHFHSGIDISTGEKEGRKVLAASDGYISRIKVSAVGFGKALYITHPNGYVTVYGHLQRFNDSLEKYVHAEQYKKESFEVELFPTEKEFAVKRGDLIAYSGNTGGSTGPHLHFEIRDRRTEEPLEPLQSSGFRLSDSIPPVIKSIAFYPLNKNGSVNDSCARLIVPMPFIADKARRVVVRGEIGFGIETLDEQVRGGSEIGIKRIELFIDEKPIYDYSIERFRFDESRFVNANIDYAENILSGKTIVLCYRLPGTEFSITLRNELPGIMTFSSNENHTGLFRVYDFKNNISEASFSFTSASKKISCRNNEPADSSVLIAYDKPFVFSNADLKISSDKLPAVYENKYITISKGGTNEKCVSAIFQVGDIAIPIHNAMNLSIRSGELPAALTSKTLIVKVDAYGNISSAGGSFENGFISTKINSFGNYAVTVDTVPPVIKATNLSTRGKATVIRFKIKIKDDLSGIATFRATLNKKWMLMEYDAKTGTLTGEQKVTKKKTSYRFRLTVTDKKGNLATYNSTLKY